VHILVTGGAGYVGGILRPSLEAEHDCTFFDLRPVAGAESRTTIGDIADADAVRRALEGKDAAIQLVMADPRVRENLVSRSYDVHVKGMHVLLQGAVDVGVRRVVYASTMSVYDGSARRYYESEDIPPDATDVYGLTKRLGEEVCRAFARAHPSLSIIALRMVLPATAEGWAQMKAAGRDTSYATGPKDLGRLYLAALTLREHTGFDALQACSDLDQKHLNLAKARALLGWEPRDE
jgi:nucleoside-diphosphate-sugar epimerase